MTDKYQYDKSPKRHIIKKSIRTLIFSVASVIVVCTIGILVIRGYSDRQKVVIGPSSITNISAIPSSTLKTVGNNLFSLQIPLTWHQTSLVNSNTQYSITWMDERTSYDTNSLTLYIDKIPTNIDINRLLPIIINGDGFTYSSLSNYCYSLVSDNANQPITEVHWQNINFMCNTSDKVNNHVGTGTAGDPINQSVIKGRTQGSHSYFFLYIDDSAEPSYTVLYDAIDSFVAK